MRTVIAWAMAALPALVHAERVVYRECLWTRENLKWGIPNGNLEASGPDGFLGWKPNNQGYEVDARVAHSGRASACCRNTSPDERRGISCVVELNQPTPIPIIVECWSRAEDVSHGRDPDYSLYVDIVYMDDTAHWGRSASCKPGTHDWERYALTFVPEKPIKHVGVHGVFRNRTGTAWFDDLQLWSLERPADTAQFDGFPVARAQGPSATPGAGLTVGSPGGLTLQLDRQTGQLVTGRQGGFFSRDAAALSHFVQPSGTLIEGADGSVRSEGEDATLGLELSVNYRALGDAVRIDGTVRDLTGADRAVTVYFAYPVDAVGWLWHDDMRVSRRIEGGQAYYNCLRVQPGANGLASKYPFACITGRAEGLVLGAPLDVPRLYRFGYDADSRELYAAVDLGLCPETESFPSHAAFSLVLYRCDPAWGFRSALERYYGLFPDFFIRRAERAGLWFGGGCGAPEAVEGLEDFGVAFHTGEADVQFDQEHGIYSFVYTEPMSLWLWMPQEMPRTYPEARAHLQSKAEAGEVAALAAPASAVYDPNDLWIGGPANLPWCKGFHFSMNPDPGLMRAMPDGPTQAGRLFERLDYATRRAENLIPGWRNLGDTGSIRQDGYSLALEAGWDGSDALRLERKADEDNAGAVQRVVLEERQPQSVTARVRTKAVDVTGRNDDRYALHVSAEYADGTAGGILWVWADTAIQEWQLLEKTVTPEKPVRALRVHLLYCAPHTGTVLYDDAFLGLDGSDRNLLESASFDLEPLTPRCSLDGMFVDSVPIWWGQCNYRREHWRAACTPLVFDGTGRLCQWMVFPTMDYARAVAEHLRPQGKMALANGSPFWLPWPAAWFDIMGHEVNWAPEGEFRPCSPELMCYRRALSYQRPYVFQVHFDTSDFPQRWVESTLKLGVAYGFFPTMGAALGGTEERRGNGYWDHPEYYNRDRPLFREYIPVMQALDSAGWEPITYARSGNPKVYVERFGELGGPLYLTVFNDSQQRQRATISLDTGALGLAAGDVEITEVLSGQTMTVANGQLRQLNIDAEDVKVVRLAE